MIEPVTVVQTPPSESIPEMHEREITLTDGRYMVFFTFDEAGTPAESKLRETESNV